MQYGDLTEAQIARFDTALHRSVREPSFVVWIEGFGDPTEYAMEIDSEIALEYPRGRGRLSAGRAILVMSNENGYFYSDGKSKVEKNAMIKVWAGFDGLNIPIFTGTVYSVKPTGTTDVVTLNCKDYMGLFQEVLIKGSQYPNNTAKLLMEDFCNRVNIPAPSIASTDETNSIYTQPVFEEQSIFSALEEVCDSIFYTAYLDEDGNLNAVEREHSMQIPPFPPLLKGGERGFTFKDNNVIDCENLADTEIINDITIEYRENFFSRFEDRASIDTYGRRARSDRTLLLNSTLVSEKTAGSTAEELNHDMEAFKFASAGDAAFIDCLHIKMKKDNAHGYITASVYSDSGGVPDVLLGMSQLKASDSLSSEFAWEIFHFSTPVEIWPSTDYWVAIDTSSVSSGTIYVQISGVEVSAKHAYHDGTWQIEDNKQVLHRIRGSFQTQRVAEDVVRFYRTPHERIRIIAPAVPHLQLLDEVLVSIELREIQGHYIVEGRRHIITPEKYTTVDTLRKRE